MHRPADSWVAKYQGIRKFHEATVLFRVARLAASLADSRIRLSRGLYASISNLSSSHRLSCTWLSVCVYMYGAEMMKPGVYALEVRGVLNPEVEEFLKSKGIPFRAKAPGAV